MLNDNIKVFDFEDPTNKDSSAPDNPPTEAISELFPLAPIPSRARQGLEAGQLLRIYIFGSRALHHALQILGVTAYIIGVTSRRDVKERILDKSLRAYASTLADPAHPDAGSRCIVGGNDVFLERITDAVLASVQVPNGLAIVDGVIEVRLLPGVTVEAADKAVAQVLAGRSLNRYLGTPDGQKRLIEAGIPPSFRFCTLYDDIGPAPRLSAAQEVFLIRPKRELQALLDAIAQALAGRIA